LNRFTLAIAGALLALIAFGATTASAQSISAKQASLDEHQDACTDAGGTVTSWHFIINQVRVGAPPANIMVTFSNGDTQNVPLAKTSGPVGHYNVSGTATHTLITSATATIYDGWSGQFNLSSVECSIAPELDACAAREGRTVIEINTLLGGSFFGLSEQSAVIPVMIAPGTYTVTLGSFDDHVGHPGQPQFFEQWFARFITATTTVESGEISDLPPEPVVSLDEVVGEITLTETATGLQAVHFLAGGAFTTPESIMATCVALDPVLD
jgi:hypothetical protein